MRMERMERTVVTRYHQNRQVAWREIEEQSVLIDPTTGTVFVLNGTGSRIWSYLEEPLPRRDIVRRISSEHRQDEQVVYRDVSRFLEALMTRGLIEVQE